MFRSNGFTESLLDKPASAFLRLYEALLLNGLSEDKKDEMYWFLNEHELYERPELVMLVEEGMAVDIFDAKAQNDFHKKYEAASGNQEERNRLRDNEIKRKKNLRGVE